MFNRVVCAATRNIRDNMSKSRKKTPAGTWCCCKSQKKGKQVSHRRFRRCEKMVLLSGKEILLPLRQFELTNQYDLGGDGKRYYGYRPNEEWFVRVMRK